MQGQRVRAAALTLLVVAGAAAACGDDDNSPASGPRDGGTPSNDANIEPVADTGPPPVSDAGTFTIEDVADTPCATRGGSIKEVFAPDATNFRPLDLVAVGPRRAMRTDDGFVMFDADGANGGNLVTSSVAVTAIGSSPNVLAALGPEGTALKLARFDANGAAQGTALLVAPQSSGFGVGGGEGRLLATWAADSELRAAAFTEQGVAIAPQFSFRSGTAEVEGATFAVVHAGGEEFGVAFAGQYAKQHRLVFTRVSTTKRVDTSFTLLLGAEALRLVGMARAESKFAILVERKTTAGREIIVVLLDSEGRFAGPAKRLLGTQKAFGIASSGGEFGVVAWRSGAGSDPTEPTPDAIEFRPFDGTGAPLGSWVCLDEPFTAPTLDVGASILGEDSGYSVAMRTPKKAVSMVRFDRRGTGQ